MTNPATEPTPADQIRAWMRKHDVTLDATFIPWSQSRNKAEKSRSLNWRVTVRKGARDVVTVDYSAGIAHCPSYSQRTVHTVDVTNRINHECETGRAALAILAGQRINPDDCNVLASLAMDSSVIDAGGFESWAADFGYDPDSRKAESIYRACLETALRMRAGLGEAAMAELAAACRDY